MVKLSQTRWLSREKVISTVIEQYGALILYFEKECKTDKVDRARKIFDTLTNSGTKHMLLFLQNILQKVNAINTQFQSEHFQLHQIYAMITSEYKSILNCFIKEEILFEKNLSEIDPQDMRSQKPISDVYLRGQCFSQSLNDSLQDESCTIRFKSDCFKFLLELSLQMKKRLLLDENGITAKLNVAY